MIPSANSSETTPPGASGDDALRGAVDPIGRHGLILGVDRFMSECRSLTNFTGNAVATIVVSRWEGGLDEAKLAAALGGRSIAASDDRPASAAIAPDVVPRAAQVAAEE